MSYDSLFSDFMNENYARVIHSCNSFLLKLDPSDKRTRSVLMVNRAAAYLELGMFKHCIKDARAVSKIDPYWLRPKYLAIKALTFRGKRVEAVKIYNKWKTLAGVGCLTLQDEVHNFLFSRTDEKKIETKNKNQNKIKSIQEISKDAKKISVPKTSRKKETKDKKTKDKGKKKNKNKSKEKGKKKNKDKCTPGDCKKLAHSPKKIIDNESAIQDESRTIAIGYYHVNAGQLHEALDIFGNLLKKNSNIHSARIGRGSVYALQGEYNKAISDFNAVIKKQRNNIDALVRLGQTRAAKSDLLRESALTRSQAKEQLVYALRTLTRAVEVIEGERTTSADAYNAYHQRAVVYRKMEDHFRTILDLREATRRNPDHLPSINLLGLSLTAVGECEEAMDVFKKHLQREPTPEVYNNIAQCYQNYGDTNTAEKYFTLALSIGDPAASNHFLRGLARYFSGRIHEAIEDFTKRQHEHPNHSSLHMRGTAYHSLGQFHLAIDDYDQLLSQNPVYPAMLCWFRRQIVPVVQRLLDTPFTEYHFDNQLHPSLKDVYLKIGNPDDVDPSYKHLSCPLDDSIMDVNLRFENLTSYQKKLRRGTKRLGCLLQYNTPGFFSNIRQQRMFGFAVIEISQNLKKHWKKAIHLTGKGSSKNQNPHVFGWRDMIDIALRWRQHSEPNDPVFWIDLLPWESFEAGFGLQTPLINGQMKVVKYYCYFDRCFEIMKKLMASQSEHTQKKLSAKEKERLKKYKTLEQLHKLIGHDFFVISPCNSRIRSTTMEGTRLTLQKKEFGYLFSIRTPGTPSRFKQFDKELSKVFKELEQYMKQKPQKRNMEKCVELCLIIYFYWTNFGALTRGTAACGLIILNALLISTGYVITKPLPNGVQIDWEAITTPKHTDFLLKARGWLDIIPLSEDKSGPPFDSLPDISLHITTLREMIQVMNVR